jgi:DNA invertase Pin-like site-specific DNA recombinase
VSIAPPKSIEGYVDQPMASDAGCADAARLRLAGVTRVHYEIDVVRRSVLRELVKAMSGDTVLVVVALDRLGRPLGRLLESLSRFKKAGVCIRSLEDGVDMDMTPEGRAQGRIIDALSSCTNGWEARRAQHRAETMAERGSRPGAQPKLGSSSPEQVLVMLTRPGASRASVARELGVGRTTLYRFLRGSQAAYNEPNEPRRQVR